MPAGLHSVISAVSSPATCQLNCQLSCNLSAQLQLVSSAAQASGHLYSLPKCLSSGFLAHQQLSQVIVAIRVTGLTIVRHRRSPLADDFAFSRLPQHSQQISAVSIASICHKHTLSMTGDTGSQCFGLTLSPLIVVFAKYFLLSLVTTQFCPLFWPTSFQI